MKQFIILIVIFFAGCIPYLWINDIPEQKIKCKILEKGIDIDERCKRSSEQFRIQTDNYIDYFNVTHQTYITYKQGDSVIFSLPIRKPGRIERFQTILGGIGIIVVAIFMFVIIIIFLDE